MTTNDVVRRLRAFEQGRTLQCGETLRVPRLPDAQQFVIALVKMGGESAPWGVAYGRPGKPPTVLTVPEPRTRDDVAEMMANVAPPLLTHLHHPKYSPFGPDPDQQLPPFQVWLPNESHLEMLHHLAYAYTFTKFGAASRYTVLNQLGHACGWLFRESQRPGQTIVMVATEVLREAYTVPAEMTRQGHLGFLLAWIGGKGGREVRMTAAAEVEQHSMATSLDPAIERDELAPYVEMYNTARNESDSSTLERGRKRIHKMLEEELLRRFRLTEEAITLLGKDKRRENHGLFTLVKESMTEHRLQYRRIERDADDKDDGPGFRPSPETDRHPSAAASRYYVQEASQELRDVMLVHDDRELQAELVAAGEAIAGTITSVKNEGTGRRIIPVWEIDSSGELPLRLRQNSDLCVVGLRDRKVKIRSIERTPDLKYHFIVEVTSLLTVPRNDDGSVVPATSPTLKGQSVILVKPSMDQIARRKSGLIWKRDVPGAWLTHRVPKVKESDLPDEVGEDLQRIETGTR